MALEHPRRKARERDLREVRLLVGRTQTVGTAWVFFILGGIAAATAIQELYERAF